MSKEVLLEDKVDNFIKEYKAGALLVIGGISIVNSIITEVTPTSNEFFYKWIDRVLGPVLISDILKKEMDVKLENDILDMINTTMLLINRADLLLNRIFQQISNSPDFVKDFLTVVQTYIGLEKMGNESTYKEHQKFVNIIYKEDFKLSKDEVEDIKSGAKLLLDKLKEGGINFN